MSVPVILDSSIIKAAHQCQFHFQCYLSSPPIPLSLLVLSWQLTSAIFTSNTIPAACKYYFYSQHYPSSLLVPFTPSTISAAQEYHFVPRTIPVACQCHFC